MAQKRPKQYNPHECMVCTGCIQAYELVSGIPYREAKNGDVEQLYGHYLHVRAELPPERLVRAVELHLMPLLGEEAFEGHVLKTTLAKIHARAQASPLTKVYEFIRS